MRRDDSDDDLQVHISFLARVAQAVLVHYFTNYVDPRRNYSVQSPNGRCLSMSNFTDYTPDL